MSALSQSLNKIVTSSLGKKFIVALTGLMLAGFVLGHMAGNLLFFVGPDALNAYASQLQSMGPLLWVARISLLVAVVLHVVFTIKLTRENRAARPHRYEFEKTIQASGSSRIMIWSGLTVLAFIVYHLMHFTLKSTNPEFASLSYNLDGVQVHNVYKMVVAGFSSIPVAIFYLIANGLLASHLSHGVASVPQTLGISTGRTRALYKKIGLAFAALILIGNSSIPLAVLLGFGK